MNRQSGGRWWMASYAGAALAAFGVVAVTSGPVPAADSGPSKHGTGRGAAETGPLAEVMADLAKQKASQPSVLSDSLSELKSTLVPADDIPGAAQDILEKIEAGGTMTPEMAVRVYHWLHADPTEAIAFLKDNPSPQTAQVVCAALKLLAGEMTSPAFFALTADAGHLFTTNEIRIVLGKKIAAEKDAESMLALIAKNPQLRGGALTGTVAKEWPLDDPQGMAAVIRGCGAVSMFDVYARRLSNDRALQWVDGLRAEGTNPALESLSRYLFSAATDLPFDQRMAGAGGAGNRSERMSKLISYDLTRSQNAEAVGDATRAFATGRMTAEETLEGIRTIFPKLADGAPEQLRTEVFKMLAATDPSKAVKLLDGLTPAERAKTAIEVGGTLANPERMKELFAAVPFDRNASNPQERFEAWAKAVPKAYATYGDDYTDWVLAMPNGIDRDMALSMLATEVHRKYPEQAAHLRAQKNFEQPDDKPSNPPKVR